MTDARSLAVAAKLLRLIPTTLLLVGLASCTAAPTPDPLASAADLFGARLGMAYPEVLARMPKPGPCKKENGPKEVFIECGAQNLSAGFTAGGRASWVTASYDLTDTRYSLAAARAALVARYGKGVDVKPSGMVWLPPGSTADPDRCPGAAMLLEAEADLPGAREDIARRRPVPAGCLPLRWAILATHGDHHALIVLLKDPRARVAEVMR